MATPQPLGRVPAAPVTPPKPPVGAPINGVPARTAAAAAPHCANSAPRTPPKPPVAPPTVKVMATRQIDTPPIPLSHVIAQETADKSRAAGRARLVLNPNPPATPPAHPVGSPSVKTNSPPLVPAVPAAAHVVPPIPAPARSGAPSALSKGVTPAPVAPPVASSTIFNSIKGVNGAIKSAAAAAARPPAPAVPPPPPIPPQRFALQPMPRVALPPAPVAVSVPIATPAPAAPASAAAAAGKTLPTKEQTYKLLEKGLTSGRLTDVTLAGIIRSKVLSKEEVLEWALQKMVSEETISQLVTRGVITEDEKQRWQARRAAQLAQLARANAPLPAASASTSSVSASRTSAGAVASPATPFRQIVVLDGVLHTADELYCYFPDDNSAFCLKGMKDTFKRQLAEKENNPNLYPTLYGNTRTTFIELSTEKFAHFLRIKAEKNAARANGSS